MKMFKIVLISAIALFSTSCQSKNKDQKPLDDKVAFSGQDLKGFETAYFASGCFWCVEAVFESVAGVKEVVSGYAGGTEMNPTYEQVAMGNTSHAEAVEVYYDPKVVSFATLVKVFFGSQDPTTLNRQGPDRGAQYRSIAFYKNDGEKKIITDHIAKLTKDKVYNNPIVTEVTPFSKFYVAEDYHQDYERKHPNNPYIQGVSIPRLKRFQKKFPELLKTGAH
ncbi:peptide-methionine (S)-S-oxide reductase MsrA [Sediminicola sp. 1XM1-17]|uniref:peptide-methionine (S)-S-oxide reductase MsrA n=1 Tax=Sediminicola sp. 1XM1-17 TaxID=3127702 RepID=UPI003076EEDF